MFKKIGFGFFNAIGATGFCRAQKKNKITILNLHRISPERDFFFNPMTPSHFETLLKYVSKHYTVVTISGLNELKVSDRTIDKPYLVISFDDGYYDFFEYALPLLVKYKLPCNHNIVNSCADKNEIIWTHRLNNIFNHAREKNIPLHYNEDGWIIHRNNKPCAAISCHIQNPVKYSLPAANEVDHRK